MSRESVTVKSTDEELIRTMKMLVLNRNFKISKNKTPSHVLLRQSDNTISLQYAYFDRNMNWSHDPPALYWNLHCNGERYYSVQVIMNESTNPPKRAPHVKMIHSMLKSRPPRASPRLPITPPSITTRRCVKC